MSLIRFRSRASKGVITDMPLENFGHEAVHGPARRGDQTQDITTFRLAVECSRQRLDLAADARHPLGKFPFLPNRVRHRLLVYPGRLYAPPSTGRLS